VKGGYSNFIRCCATSCATVPPRICRYAEIAERLGISAHKVGSHIKNLYRKLDVHCAAAAVMKALELEVIGSRTAG
jgi:hypothetical protein